MAKTIVINTEEMKTPFLRGILTSSLLDIGMSFDQAYQLASLIRQDLLDKNQVTTEELRKKVITLLNKKKINEDIIERYIAPANFNSTIMVKNMCGGKTPFSRSQHRLGLEACGLSSEKAITSTEYIYEILLNLGKDIIHSGEIGCVTYQYLLQEYGQEIAQYYVVWYDFLHSGRPLIVLIGGTAGVGKSTIAIEVGHRLGIVRSQSTDILREVMRMMTPAELLPVLHSSSFTAWEQLPENKAKKVAVNEQIVINGYLRQAEILSLACKAVISRALEERVSIIMEGVHVKPSLIKQIPTNNEAIIVPIILSVLKSHKLKERIEERGKTVHSRRSQRYLKNLKQIWTIQSYLMDEAENHHVPIVSNLDREKTIQEVMKTIVQYLTPHFSHDPNTVFLS